MIAAASGRVVASVPAIVCRVMPIRRRSPLHCKPRIALLASSSVVVRSFKRDAIPAAQTRSRALW
jgi:hypothetical protein